MRLENIPGINALQPHSIHLHFTTPLLNWFNQFGRKDLPWQAPYDAYRVWISEIMLQQTQVKTVIPYFLKFIEHYPNVRALAKASQDEILANWSGLGYYSRARNLHRAAKIIVEQYQGIFPNNYADLLSLPGVGASTAAAIASLAFNAPFAILDGNVKRVLSRYFLIEGDLNQNHLKKELEKLAILCMCKTQCRNYSQAIMDLGALICTPNKAQCDICPLQKTCEAHLQNKVSNYPYKPVKKKRPTKEETCYIFITKDLYIYLEKRPNQGIWGGLWCFPTQTTTKDIQAEPFFTMSHQFTHFQLNLTALLVPSEAQAHPETDTARWFSLYDLHAQQLILQSDKNERTRFAPQIVHEDSEQVFNNDENSSGKTIQKIGLAKPTSLIVAHLILKAEQAVVREFSEAQ